jgi:hypothetical protein
MVMYACPCVVKEVINAVFVFRLLSAVTVGVLIGLRGCLLRFGSAKPCYPL